MVKKLSKEDEAAIENAIAAAHGRISAKIGAVVVPLSDHYQDFILFYGLMLGSIVSLLLWTFGIGNFPELLTVQLAITMLADLAPWLRCLCIRLIPQSIRHHRAAAMAHREYLALRAETPKDQPFVLLFVSLAERYVHVFTSPAVHRKIPGNWDAVTGTFIGKIRKEGVRVACIHATGHIAEILAPHFPR